MFNLRDNTEISKDSVYSSNSFPIKIILVMTSYLMLVCFNQIILPCYCNL